MNYNDGQYRVKAEKELSEVQYQMNEDAIDRMRKRPKNWANIMMAAANILVFLLVELTGSSEDTSHMITWGAAYTPLISDGQFYRLFTCMFLHFGFEHLFNNMLLLIFIGDYLERYVGKLRYLAVYLIGGLGGSVASYIFNVETGQAVVSAGASGAVFAVIGGMLYIVIRNKGRLEDISLQRLMLMAALSIYFGFASGGVDNAAHIGGLVCGMILCILVYRKRATHK